jgi:hypothetical protein
MPGGLSWLQVPVVKGAQGIEATKICFIGKPAGASVNPANIPVLA